MNAPSSPGDDVASFNVPSSSKTTGRFAPDSRDDEAPTPAGNESGESVALAEALSLPLSQSLRGVIRRAQETAVRERFRGLMGTGLMLLELVAAGREAPADDPFYAPRFLADRLEAATGDGFAAARARFFDLNRLPDGLPAREPDAISASLWGVLQEAMALPRHDGILAARHLIVALLTYRPAGRDKAINAWEILEDAGADRTMLLAAFLVSLRDGGPLPEREDWGARAASLATPLAGTGGVGKSPATGPLIAGYGADTPSGRAADDCLDLGATVDAMANLIASPLLDGNLSLGVFGHWGSGKSFFMRRLQGAIDDLTKRARNEAAADHAAAPAYWPNIAQVEFNAWHYVDANLWASLMAHLLGELRRWDPAARNLEVQSPIERAINQLQITSAARAEAEQRVRTSRAGKAAAEAALHNARQRLDSATRRLAQVAARSLWSWIETRTAPEREQAVKLLKELGMSVEEAGKSVEAVYAQVRDLTATGNRIQLVLHQLIRRDSSREIRNCALIVGLPLLLVVLLAFTPWGEWLRQAGVVLATALAATAGAAARISGWVRRNAAEILDTLAPLSALRARFEHNLATAETLKSRALETLERQVTACQSDVATASAELSAREKEVRDAIQAVGDAVSGRAIQQFIEQRLDSGDYQKHLGLIATIRRDFEQLSDLVRAHNATRLQLPAEVAVIEDKLRQARPDITAAEITALFTNIGINRIVLYIDDLDRCPSDRVVEVLQAIHLLVSFPIFVVVVGVDSRWMAHSLAREYPALLTRGTREESAAAGWSRDAALSVVTPSDYLEKIFQIPFWVPPLHTPAAQKLIAHLVGEQTSAGTKRHAGNKSPPNALRPHAVAAQTPQSNVAEPAARASTAIQPTGALSTAQAPQGIATSEPPTAARPEMLRISRDEQEAMESLAVIIGRSPRATKRFVNSYRLLKAALTPAEHSRFAVSDEHMGMLAAAMFLLSVVTGTPSLAAPLVTALPKNEEARVIDLLFALADWSAEDPVHAEAARRVIEFQSSDAPARWETLAARDLLPWVGRISQFSFENLAYKEASGTAPSKHGDPLRR